MEDVKSWTVTYTKHVNRKRKVHHDGLLEVCSLTNKLMLYDDRGKLLDTRLIQKDDFVKSGETLAFNAFLIDIGDPQGTKLPVPNLNVGGSDKKTSVKTDWKDDAKENKAPLSHPKFSHKIIREFKKSALQNQNASQSSPDSTKYCIRAWQVLYTTHTTQKAKKYHDGILEITNSGSHCSQVKLYDATRKLLESRFSRKGEIIESGQSLKLDAHLVDIGEPEQGHVSQGDLNVLPNNSNKATQAASRSSVLPKYHTPASCPDTTTCNIKEWQVLYTTQVTQKAKKFHDGFLQIVASGIQRRQVKLFDTSRAQLNSRFLRQDEIIESGCSLTFDAHLVDIGDPARSKESLVEISVQKPGCNKHEQIGISHDSKAMFKGEPQIKVRSRKEATPNTCKIESSPNIPLRDARQILSCLMKPPAMNIDAPSESMGLEFDPKGADSGAGKCHHEDGSVTSIESESIGQPTRGEKGNSREPQAIEEGDASWPQETSHVAEDIERNPEEVREPETMQGCPSFDLGF